MPKTIEALAHKGYRLSSDSQASYHLLSATNAITFNESQAPILIDWDINGAAVFKKKSKKLDVFNVAVFDPDKKYYATTFLWRYKVYLPKNSEAKTEAAVVRAFDILDRRISKQVKRRIVNCEG